MYSLHPCPVRPPHSIRFTPSEIERPFLFNNFRIAPSHHPLCLPFVFNNLQTAFLTTPAFSEPSALPPDIFHPASSDSRASALTPLSTAFAPIRFLSPLSTAFTQNTVGGGTPCSCLRCLIASACGDRADPAAGNGGGDSGKTDRAGRGLDEETNYASSCYDAHTSPRLE